MLLVRACTGSHDVIPKMHAQKLADARSRHASARPSMIRPRAYAGLAPQRIWSHPLSTGCVAAATRTRQPSVHAPRDDVSTLANKRAPRARKLWPGPNPLAFPVRSCFTLHRTPSAMPSEPASPSDFRLPLDVRRRTMMLLFADLEQLTFNGFVSIE